MRVSLLFSKFTVLAAAVAFLTILVSTTDAETAEQRQALYDFYKATNKGSGWNANCKVGGWLAMDIGGPPVIVCNNASAQYFTNYFGLRCTEFNGNIWRFKFTQCNLQGTLPRSLMALVDLEYVDLWNNQLTGTLPHEFISWTKVNYLSVAKNRITGTLPRHWVALTKLTKLYLDTNLLVGTVPPEWGRLELLTEINVNINQLTGTVPVEWQNGMKVINSVGPCFISGCSWTPGVGGQCTANPSTCTSVLTYYNCLNLTVLPPSNASNTWNWADSSKTKFGTQRTDCPPYQPTPSRSLSLTAFPQTATVSNSLSDEATYSGGLSASTISHSGEVTSSSSQTATVSNEATKSVSNEATNSGGLSSSLASTISQSISQSREVSSSVTRSSSPALLSHTPGLSLPFRRRTDSVSLSRVDSSISVTTWSSSSRSASYASVSPSSSSSSSESHPLRRTDTNSHVARMRMTPSPLLSSSVTLSASPQSPSNSVRPTSTLPTSHSVSRKAIGTPTKEASQSPTLRVVGRPTPSKTTTTTMNGWCGLLPPPALRWSSAQKPLSAASPSEELPLLTWNSLTSATMLGNDAIGKRCLGWLHVTTILNEESSGVKGDEGSGGSSSSSWFDAVSLSRHVRVLANDKVFQSEFDNITVIPSPMDDAQNRTAAEVWLCTTIPQGFRLGGVRNSAMWVQILLPMHCGEEPEGLSPFFLSRPLQLRLVYPDATSSSTGRASDVTTLGDASQWSKARNAVPVTRTATRVIPMLQRTGATGCGDEVDPGLYSFDDTSMHQETQRVGSLFGNLLAVLVLYVSASVGSLCISVALHRQAVGWEAVRESHIASLWMPIVAMVLVPLTTNSVALIVDADATHSFHGWVAAVVSLLAVAGYVGYVGWVGVTAQRRLQMELATALQQQRVMKGAWWVVRALLKPETHWVARTADDVPFKRHHQITLEPATVWWYNTFEALLGVLIGIVCGISQATGSPRPGCIASLSVAMSSQLLLFGIVVIMRPHSNLLGHHFTCCTALLSAIISALQLVATFVIVEPSTAAALLEGTAALTLVMAGASLVQYALMAVGVLLWMMPRKRRESKHLQVPQANKTTKVRGTTTKPIRIDDADAEEVGTIPLLASSQEDAHKTVSAQEVAETTVHINDVNGLHEPKLACNPSTTVVVEGNEDEHSTNNKALDEQHEEVTPYKSQRYFDGLSESQRQLRSYLQQALTGTLNQDELLSSSRGNSFSFSFAEHTAQQPNRQANSLTREPSSQTAMKRRRGSSRTSRGRR